MSKSTLTAIHKSQVLRRRLIAGAIILVVLPTVAAVFGVFDGRPTEQVRAALIGFEQSDDDQSILGIVVVTNMSSKVVRLLTAHNFASVYCRFVTRSSTGDVVWAPLPSSSSQASGTYDVPPRSEARDYVRLPNDGRKGRVMVILLGAQQKLPSFLASLRRAWWKLRPPRSQSFLVQCDEEIECPRLRPDGSVEPPRLLPKDRKAP
ncbi:MAG: hypothetical protein QOF48_1805 [Verrucomicrobiota bacterium]|jgi:hypothetical protein